MRHALVLGVLVSLSGCSLKMIALKSTVALLEVGKSAFYDESDTLLAKDTMLSQFKLLEALLMNDPRNKKILLLLAEGYSGYSFLFLEESDPDRAKAFYRRGLGFSRRLLHRAHPGWLDTGDLDAFTKELTRAKKKDVPALFWMAHSWGGIVNLSRNDMEALADLPLIVAAMNKVLELDPGYNYAGADLFFGAYYASRPRIIGGDPKKAKTHFDKAAELNGGKFLMGTLLEARYYAVSILDEELFASLLAQIASSPAGRLKDSRLIDEVAKEKALVLKEKADDLF